MANKCETCGSELNFVPAGVSKRTGKEYNAFWSCPNKCKQGFVVQCAASKKTIYKINDNPPNWDKIRAQKTDNIKWLNALNNSCLAFANGKIEKEKIIEMANWIYELEPQNKKSEQPF